MEILKGFGRLFYIISPNETSFERIEDLPEPDFVTQATPFFFTLIFLEYCIQFYKSKPRARLNDGITSLSHGIYLGCHDMITRGLLSYFYIKLYENFALFSLPWDSPWTWYFAALGVDFGYYWVHRGAHEINLFWAEHQVHHSSEDYNLTTALRQSVLLPWTSWLFYLPLAFLGLPPSVLLIHQQFNLLFQFWIHTEVIDNLGILENVLNTPRHHRIHHGSNRYCLDKNYGGVLIIWDKLFGTFAEEKKGEKIVYGLVEEIKSFNPFYLQFFYYPKIWNKINEQDNTGDKLSALLKGPGWSKGKPRLGDPNDCPEVPIRQKYDVNLSTWKNIYVVLHFIIVIIGFDYLSRHLLSFGQLSVIFGVFYILFSLTSIGFILEDRGKIGAISEIGRCGLSLICIFFFAASHQNNWSIWTQLLYGMYGFSVAIWSLYLTTLAEKDKINNTKNIKG